MLDFIVKIKRKHYSQTLLEDCKYEIKMTKMESFINGKLEPSQSDDESDSDSDSDMISISSRFSLYIFFFIQ